MKDKKVNEYLIKILSSAIPVETPLEIDDDVILVVDGTVVKTEDKTNNDGTVNRYLHVKVVNVEVANNEELLN